MMKAISILVACIVAITFSCCNYKEDKNKVESSEKNNQTLLLVDQEFSNACTQNGMKNAYLDYIDSNGVLLRPNNFPIIGAESIDYIIAQNDANFQMSWKASNAIVSNSGELGYTYGQYELSLSNPDTTFSGTYVTIWKKQENGKWKFVLNTNNEGINEE